MKKDQSVVATIRLNLKKFSSQIQLAFQRTYGRTLTMADTAMATQLLDNCRSIDSAMNAYLSFDGASLTNLLRRNQASASILETIRGEIGDCGIKVWYEGVDAMRIEADRVWG